jgi:hypothetical protein
MFSAVPDDDEFEGSKALVTVRVTSPNMENIQSYHPQFLFLPIALFDIGDSVIFSPNRLESVLVLVLVALGIPSCGIMNER